MQRIFDLVSSYSLEVTTGLLGAVLILLIISIINSMRISSLKKKNKKMSKILTLSEEDSLKESLVKSISFREEFEGEILKVESEIRSLKDGVSKSIQNIGFIRYNAFGDMGSDLSFSVAFLDEKLNGMVLTSIYGREDSNVYAKPIKSGDSEYKLSVEEIQAIDRAMKSHSSIERSTKERSEPKEKPKKKTEDTKEDTEETSEV